MKNNILILETRSPQELESALKALPKKEKEGVRFAALNIFGPSITVSKFSLPRMGHRRLMGGLKLEAVGLLSLEPHEVELDYQILNYANDKIEGVYITISRKVLRNFISLIYKAGLIPVSITANIHSRIDAFLQNNRIRSKNFCLIDFYKDTIINLSVFNRGRWELLREIRYEHLNDAEREINNSLKYVTGRSQHKELEEIYVDGDILNKAELLVKLEKEYNKEIKHSKPITVDKETLFSTGRIFHLDLIKGPGITYDLRKGIWRIANLLFMISLLSCFVLGLKAWKQVVEIRGISSSFRESDYKMVKELQYRLNLLQNAQ